MKKRHACVYLLLLIWVFPLHAELALGGKGLIYTTFQINTEKINHSPFDGLQAFSPLLYGEGDSFTFEVQPLFTYNHGESSVNVDFRTLLFTLDEFDYFTVKIGRFLHLPGKGIVDSCTNYFHPLDFTRFLSGNMEWLYKPSNLFSIVFLYKDLYLRSSTSFFPVSPAVPDSDSPWFPTALFPQALTIEYQDEFYDMNLNEIIVEATEDEVFDLERVSTSIELGGSFEILDFSWLYYHGNDSALTVKTGLDFPFGFGNSYDVLVSQKSSIIDAFGINIETELQGWRTWGSLSWTLSKLFATTEYSTLTMANYFEDVPYLEYLIGMEYAFSYPDLSIAAEMKYAHAFSNEMELILPLYSRRISSLISLELFRRKVSLREIFILSLKDFSIASVFQVSYKPITELEFSITLPLFFGNPEEEFGMFRNNYLIGAGISVIL